MILAYHNSNNKNCVKEGKMCGGIQGLSCCENLKCDYGENEGLPDSSGTCINNDENRETDIECEDYTYSNCPPDKCLKTCISSSNCPINNTACVGTADCEGKGSCYEKKEIRKNLTKEEFRKLIEEKTEGRKIFKFEEKTGQECVEGCTCTGVVMKCETENGREMTIYAKSGNIIFQVKGVNASTQITLYHHNKTTYAELENKTIKEIKIMPDEVEEKLEKKIKNKIENQTITLNKDGFYEIRGKKKARLFFLFLVREKVDAKISAEDGEIIKIRNPWWGFLAKDTKEEVLLEESCGTVTPETNDECCQNKGFNSWNAETQECI